MGELKGGMVFDVSMGMARRLLMTKQREEGKIAVLEELGEKVAFEIAVGRNGKVWVKAGAVKETLIVGRALLDTDSQAWGVEEQVKMVTKILRQV
jgi:exosome complex component RRP40